MYTSRTNDTRLTELCYQNEHIVATAFYYYSCSNIKPSSLSFRQFVDADSLNDYPYVHGETQFLTEIFGCENNGPGVQYVGDVETKEGRLLVFPNILQHQVQPFELANRTKKGHRKILALYLVDPNVRVISTAHVPCQQMDWWKEAMAPPEPESPAFAESGSIIGDDNASTRTGKSSMRSTLKDTMKGVSKLKEKVFGGGIYPIGLEEAKATRLKLMKERKKFVKDHANQVNMANSFCLDDV